VPVAYTRHGTVNILNSLIVHGGRMEARSIETKDAAHYIEELERFRRRHQHIWGVYLMHDGDPSHTVGCTREVLPPGKGWRCSAFIPSPFSGFLPSPSLELSHLNSYRFWFLGSAALEELLALCSLRRCDFVR
jgi:hypothetical protein